MLEKDISYFELSLWLNLIVLTLGVLDFNRQGYIYHAQSRFEYKWQYWLSSNVTPLRVVCQTSTSCFQSVFIQQNQGKRQSMKVKFLWAWKNWYKTRGLVAMKYGPSIFLRWNILLCNQYTLDNSGWFCGIERNTIVGYLQRK